MKKYLFALFAAVLSACAAVPFPAARINVPIVFGKPGSASIMTGYGTAFLVSVDGSKPHLLTAGHVCEMAYAGRSKLSLTVVAGEAKVTTESGGIEVEHISGTADLCELRIKEELPPTLPVLKLAAVDPVIAGGLTLAGAPFGVFPVETKATFSGRVIDEDGRVFGLGAGLAGPGNSGSPVIDSDNEVQGVLVMGYQFIFMYVPHDEVRRFVNGEL